MVCREAKKLRSRDVQMPENQEAKMEARKPDPAKRWEMCNLCETSKMWIWKALRRFTRIHLEKTQLIRTDFQHIVLPMAADIFFLFLIVGDQHCLRSTVPPSFYHSYTTALRSLQHSFTIIILLLYHSSTIITPQVCHYFGILYLQSGQQLGCH